jgi:hypothetical protein
LLAVVELARLAVAAAAEFAMQVVIDLLLLLL